MRSLLLIHILGLASFGRTSQPKAANPIAAPLRDLKFGTLNFLHTTDTHGWHAGHLLEASFSADWGDYLDFSSRLREKIEAEGNDLLIVDTGDRIEGNGLYDSSSPQGKYTFGIFTEQPVDVICIGNHELYKLSSALNELNILVPAYSDAYIASNLDIVNPSTGKLQALAPRFRKFTTKNQRIRILAFGFLFNFNLNVNGTVVQPVEKTVQESWFQEALDDEALDLIIVAAHSAAHSDELLVIYKAIRVVKPDIPIQMFAGHYHIRDYKRFDDKAYALASGRFMETIGFQSIDGLQGDKDHYGVVTADSPPLTWFRSYIDNNLYSFYHHSNKSGSDFHSAAGLALSGKIDKARKALKLDEIYGCSPTDLWMSRAPFPAPDSIFTWLNESVFPETVVQEDRRNKSRIIISNTGAIRFDIFEGAFTRDSTWIISPFTSRMHYIKDVPITIASKVTELLNKAPQSTTQDLENVLSNAWRLAPPEQWTRTSDFVPTPETQQPPHQIPLQANSNQKIFPGYTTTDDLGTDGDDTIHSPITFYRSPNSIQSYVASNTSATVVDLIFNQYLDPFMLIALKVLGAPDYKQEDILTYLGGETMTEMIVRWVKKNWDKNC